MARPRVFVSSTFYDLKHVRAALDIFVRSLGFESVLSEKGDIAYSFERPLDESCYAEVPNADIFVLIVGGRYGSHTSDTLQSDEAKFLERYDSITKREYETAADADIPIYVLVEKGVFAEFQTYKANRDANIKYAHVDSVNVFRLLEDILTKPRNNPTYTFERFTEIEDWLREQWAGLFRDLLKRSGQQTQLRALNEQVSEMRELNETLKAYMEAVVTQVVTPDESANLIDNEDRRRAMRRIERALESNEAVEWLSRMAELSPRIIIDIIRGASTIRDLFSRLEELYPRNAKHEDDWLHFDDVISNNSFIEDVNIVRSALGLPDFRRTRSRRRPPTVLD